MKRLLIAVALVLLAVPAFARLSKYKDWPNSPEGYFMTKAERAEWSRLDSDADAEKFIADFVAKRPANFEKEVADRAANADKYLTVAKTPGSKSLRGKVVILFGAPSSIDVANEVRTTTKRDNPYVSTAMSNANTQGTGADAGSKGGGESFNTPGNTMSTSQSVRVMHFAYGGDIAHLVDRKSVDINVEIDPLSGKDMITSRSAESDLNAMFETIAESWIKK
ncbi:MAG TPA: GWxTD domain-containing protein [Thermoanaerobaculia bacterium]|jgi:GWxTD domain-containing protein